MLSSILAFASGLAAKVVLPIKRDPIDIEIIVRLQTELNDLRRDFNETLTRVERQRDDWQALAMRYRDELHAGAPPQRQFIDEEMRLRMQAQMRVQALQPPMMQQAMMQQAMMQQANTQAQQNGLYLGQQAQQNGQQLGQIGMQGFGQQLDEYVRNCTPGRHELLTRG
jgi:hypothetical protein